MCILTIESLDIKTVLGREEADPSSVSRSNSRKYSALLLDSGRCSAQAHAVVLGSSPVDATPVPDRENEDLPRRVVDTVDDAVVPDSHAPVF